MLPAATSATLGDKGDPAAMLDFARTVFGEDFHEDAVVTETRQSLDEWLGEEVDVDFRFFATDDLVGHLGDAGLRIEAVTERAPGAGEVETRQAYVLARR